MSSPVARSSGSSNPNPNPNPSRTSIDSLLERPENPPNVRFELSAIREPRFIKPMPSPSLANLMMLDGKSNYQEWSDQITMVFKASGLYKVAIEGAVLLANSSIEERTAYNEIKSASILLFIQLISSQILKQCKRIYEPNALWNHLKSQFFLDTPFSFVH